MNMGTDIVKVEMVMTDDAGRMAAQYQDLVVVFTKENADKLPPH
jgi:hypothetical protein